MQFKGTLIPCRLCGSQPDTHIVLAEKDRKGQPLRTVRCPDCNLVFSNPMPTDEELTKFYSSQYRQLYKGAHGPKPRRILRAVRNALGRAVLVRSLVPAPAKTLDVGSGGGELVYSLKRFGYDAQGIEPGTDYAEFSRDAYGIDIHIAPFLTFEGHEGSFDIVTTFHVVEHLPEPKQFFNFAAKQLKPGGFLLIEVPNIGMRGGSFHGRFHMAHVHHFSPSTMQAFAEKSGFKLHANYMPEDAGVVFMSFTLGEPAKTAKVATSPVAPPVDAPDSERAAAALDQISEKKAVIGKNWLSTRIGRLKRTWDEWRFVSSMKPEEIAPRLVDDFLQGEAAKHD